METVTLTIDSRPLTVAKGTTVLQAAIEAGISVPYYCYHPGLGIDGSCRVCIVKIEKMPKLQTSCSTVCTEGMVVSTSEPDVVQARAGVLEFLLVNHPLDCPVCDKGGECPLQDFSYAFGPAESRMDFPRRVFDGEGVKADVDFGPTLMLNRNRCILCTRCVRFMKEVDTDAQIGVIDRGAGSEIATFQEEGVQSLLSGNLMDVCPVGAITTRDYRFKSRPWDNPAVVDTTCTLCSKGCNTSAWLRAKPEWAKGSQLVRMTPRLNPSINSYWMCDIGRFNYHWVESASRLRRPMLRQNGALAPVSWRDVEIPLRDRLQEAGGSDPRSVQFLVSAHASVEEFFVLRQLVEALLGTDGLGAVNVAWTHSEKAQPENAQFKVSSVNAPNVNGAKDIGFAVGAGNAGPADLSALRSSVESGRVKALYVIDPGPEASLGDMSWVIAARKSGSLPLLIVQGVLQSALTEVADIILPGAVWLEKDAVYTNDQGTPQPVSKALAPPGDALEDWEVLSRVASALGVTLGHSSSSDVRTAVAAAMPGTVYATLTGLVFARPVAARNWLQASNPSERWKWDFMYQDLAPVKGHNVQTEGLPPEIAFIPLRPVSK
ncbi:MAG: molybdopterin-dependent oxidoreductase [Vicinamibacterales bacterium]